MTTKSVLAGICFCLAFTAIRMIFFGKTFSTATPLEQRATVLMLIIGSLGVYHFGKQLFEEE